MRRSRLSAHETVKPEVAPAVPKWGHTSIETDSYDRRIFERLRQESPSLLELLERGSKLLPHFDEFLLDLFAILFKLNVVFNPPETVAPSAAVYRLLLDHLWRAPAIASLRRQTTLEEARAALALLLLGDRLLELLRSERLLSRGEMLDFWALSQQETDTQDRADESESADTLAQNASPAAKRQLEELRNRLRREAATSAQRLQQRAIDLRRNAAESVARQTNRLELLAHQTHQAMEERQSDSEAWNKQIGRSGTDNAALQLELAKRLADNAKLRKLASLVGHMHTQALSLRRRLYERQNQETYDVGCGAEIARLLPQELLSLRHPILKLDFARRFVESTLTQYSLRGIDSKGRGPLVVCLDASSSMAGDKEVWAKAVTLTLLDIAQRQRRRFRAICFAGTETPLYILESDGRDRFAIPQHKVLALAEHFPGGGTDFQKPLTAAVACLRQVPFRKGDIVFITDGECGVDPKWLDAFSAAKKELQFAVLSVVINVGANQVNTLRQLSDHIVPVTELTGESTRDIFTRT